MTKTQVRLEPLQADALEAIKDEFDKVSPVKISIKELANRAISLGKDNLRKQLNLKRAK